MKKYLISILLLLSFFVGVGQTLPGFPSGLPIQNLGSPGNVVDTRGIHAANAGFAWYGTFADTTECNANAFYKNVPGMTIRTGDLFWYRNSALTQWLSWGSGTLSIDTTESILLTGTGSLADPLTANLQVSAQSGNLLQIFPDGVYATTQTSIPNGLISGGLVIWQTGLTYIVTAAQYAIGGVIYNSPQTTITLANADVTDPRFDAFVVTTSNTADDITGTPAADPQNPSFDPLTQLPLTFVQVTANMTEPVFCRDSIYYISNGQTWTGVASNTGRINTTSTNNPYSVTEDVEFTLARNNDQYRVTKSTTISFATYKVLTFQIRSKATWPANSRVNIRAYAGLTPLGINVALGDGIFGFNSSITNAYQLVAIPVGNLGSGLATATNILFTISTTGSNTIGFYLDDIQLLGCDGTPTPVTGRFWSQGGDVWGTTGVLGTNDAFPVQIKANNTNHTIFNTNGTTGMTGTNPGVSFQLNTFGAADYSLRRSGTSLIMNTGSTYQNSVSGIERYRLNSATGNIWYSQAAAQQMQLDPSGTLKVGTNSSDTSALFLVNSTTRGSLPAPRMTTAQKNAIVSPATGLLVYDTDLTTYYYWNGAAWVPFGGAVTASNGLTATGSNVTLGGTLTGNTTVDGESLYKMIFTSSIPNTDSATVVIRNTSGSFGKGLFVNSTGTSIHAVTSTVANTIIVSNTSTGGGISATTSSGQTYTGNNTGGGLVAVLTTTDASTNTLLPVFFLGRQSSGTAANGIGNYIMFSVEHSTGGSDTTNTIISKWSDATTASRTSEFSITGVNSAVTGTILTIAGDGSITVGAAYQGLGAGYLAVSNTGQVTWSAGGGGGGGDALTANPLSQFAATTSAQLAGVITNETGTNLLVFSDNPVLVTPNLGTPSTLVGTNATGFPISTAISGLGTGVATALAINTGSAGAFVLFNGALGTPISGTVSTGVTLGDVTMNVTGTDATGDIYYRSAGGLLTRLPIGTNGQLIRTSAGGLPEWFTSGGGTGTVTSITLTQPSAGFTVTNSGVAATTVGTFTFALANDLLAVENLATTGIVRRTGTSTWSAGTLVGLTTEVTGTLPVANGGTGQTTYTNGQLLIGNTSGNTLTKATLTGTSNQINITNGAGSITIAHAFNPTEQNLTDGASVSWNVTNGANGVLTLNGTGRTLTLSNVIGGYTYTLRLIQGAGGSKTITTWTNVEWTGGIQPTLSTTAGAVDIVSLYYSSNTNLFYGTIATNMN